MNDCLRQSSSQPAPCALFLVKNQREMRSAEVSLGGWSGLRSRSAAAERFRHVVVFFRPDRPSWCPTADHDQLDKRVRIEYWPPLSPTVRRALQRADPTTHTGAAMPERQPFFAPQG